MIVRWLVLSTLLLPSIVMAADLAGVENPERARVNYMLNCQGCHGADGVGTVDGSVPEMKNFVLPFNLNLSVFIVRKCIVIQLFYKHIVL